MSMEKPGRRDAELVLRVYELRRDAVMRESRSAMNSKFWPRTFEDIGAVLKPDHPLNAAYRQVSSYWEMVYGMVKHGIVNAEYFLESNGEGLFLFAKVQPFLAQLRQEYSPRAFRNAEWVSRESSEGRAFFELFAARVKKTLESR